MALKKKENPRSEGVRDFIIGRLSGVRPFVPVAFNRHLSSAAIESVREKEREREMQNCMHEKMHSFVEHVIASPCEESKGE